MQSGASDVVLPIGASFFISSPRLSPSACGQARLRKVAPDDTTCPRAQKGLPGVWAIGQCGPHPLSLHSGTRAERDFLQLGFREPHTVPRDGMSIHH